MIIVIILNEGKRNEKLLCLIHCNDCPFNLEMYPKSIRKNGESGVHSIEFIIAAGCYYNISTALTYTLDL